MGNQLENIAAHQLPKPPSRKDIGQWVSEACWQDVKDEDIERAFMACYFLGVRLLKEAGSRRNQTQFLLHP